MLARRRLGRLIKQNRVLWGAFSRVRSLLGGSKTSEDAPDTHKSPSIAPD
jgi:hypothetical protein